MPGLSFIGNRKGIPPQTKTHMMQSFDSMLYAENYKPKFYVDGPHYLLGTTAHDEYPIAFHENDEFLLLREGDLFGLDSSPMESELYNLASIVFEDLGEGKNRIANWLAKIDGDFIIFIISKPLNSIVVFNDILGRLPIYFHQTNNGIMISRDLFFISSISRIKKMDRMAVAQYLLFGYPLGERTLLEGVSRLKPASLIRIDFENFDIKIFNCKSLNFENKDETKKSIFQNAKQLVSLISQLCQRRYNQDRYNVLSLSGGLDSRSVAACLSLDNFDFAGVARLTDDKKSQLDAKFAREIS